MPAAQPEFVKEQIENVLAIPASDALMISAKSGLGVEDVLEAIVKRVPPPKGSADNPLQALIFDSWFDIYRGAVVLVRVMEGRITQHIKIRLVYSNEVYEVETLGTLTPKPVALDELEAGDVGFMVANIKDVADASMGDTLTEAAVLRLRCRALKTSSRWFSRGFFPCWPTITSRYVTRSANCN